MNAYLKFAVTASVFVLTALAFAVASHWDFSP